MRRAWAYVVSVAALALVFSPVLRPSQRDSYPLSTYPMFSYNRGRESALRRLFGTTAMGGLQWPVGTGDRASLRASLAEAERGQPS